jgi:hypothetical protein
MSCAKPRPFYGSNFVAAERLRSSTGDLESLHTESSLHERQLKKGYKEKERT